MVERLGCWKVDLVLPMLNNVVVSSGLVGVEAVCDDAKVLTVVKSVE